MRPRGRHRRPELRAPCVSPLTPPSHVRPPPAEQRPGSRLRPESPLRPPPAPRQSCHSDCWPLGGGARALQAWAGLGLGPWPLLSRHLDSSSFSARPRPRDTWLGCGPPSLHPLPPLGRGPYEAPCGPTSLCVPRLGHCSCLVDVQVHTRPIAQASWWWSRGRGGEQLWTGELVTVGQVEISETDFHRFGLFRVNAQGRPGLGPANLGPRWPASSRLAALVPRRPTAGDSTPCTGARGEPEDGS